MADHDDDFVMLWSDFWKSSILQTSVVTRFVFLACLDECDADGMFRATPFYLSRKTVIPEGDVVLALEELQEADPLSTHQEEEGRRLVPMGPNLWRVPSYPDYRKRMSRMKRRWMDKRRKRDERGQDGTDADVVDSCGQVRTDTDGCGAVGTNADPVSVSVSVPVSVPVAKKDRGSGGKGKKKKKSAVKPEYTGLFEAFWKRSWKRGNKKAAWDSWVPLSADDTNEMFLVISDWTAAFERRPADKRPYVSTWLNNRGWEDDLSAELAKAKGANPQAQVGAPAEREPDQKKEDLLRQAILKHARHISKLEVPEDLAEDLVAFENKLDELSDSEHSELTLGDLFCEAHQSFCDRAFLVLLSKDEQEALRKQIRAQNKESAFERAMLAHIRRVVQKKLELNSPLDYDWEG